MLMESTDSSSGLQQPNLPPGFRFHPTDEELVVHYLKKKASSAPLPVAIIAEVDLYKFDPWELPAKATFGEQEWYFFSPRDRKYPNGARPNRAATSGYWKATGTDKPVLSSRGSQKVGVKKALVFYGGKPPKGIKTNWIMHEYRLTDNKASNKPFGCDLGNKKKSLRLDDWVLCRIYQKNNTHRPMDHDRDDSMDEMIGMVPPSISIGGQYGGKLGFQYSKGTTSFGSLLENDHNLYDGMLNTSDGINNGLISISMSNHHYASSNPKPEHLLMGQSLKRTLPVPVPVSAPSLYWTNDDPGLASKRFHGDESTNGTIERTEGDGSITTMLSHMPQASLIQQQQQAILGSAEDGVFRPNYQVSGINWYS